MTKSMFVDRQALPILATIAVCTLPHLFNFSIWTVAACLCLWSYTVAAARYSWRLPGRKTQLLLIGSCFLIAMATNEGFTIEAFVALLALMICLKLLDIHDQRNRITTVILCYFLIVGSLFFDDSIFATAYMLASVLCTTAVLIHVNHPGREARAPLKLAATLMAQAMPIMIFLFLLFPRIQGGFWGRAPIYTARTGFTDRMTFGDLANMAQSQDPAFRVEFAGAIPPEDQLYWRGIVLWEFDGQTWRRGSGQRNSPPRRSDASRKVTYTLALEPHNEHWLITLDLPMSIALDHSWILEDFTAYRWREITQRVSYSGISFLDGHDTSLVPFDKSGLRLPEAINPRTRELAGKWRAESRSTEEYIQRVLAYFSTQPFQYTLRPPELSAGGDGNSNRPENLVDLFLFESRKGFCEHYATAFAFLLRAAGIPARIVVGYLGGTLNPYGGYLLVRQSHAHAWCEVWVQEKGWIRVDPTAAVAPSRLNGDVAGAVPDEELAGLLSYFRGTPLEPWLNPVASVVDLINSRWNKWVMGYSAFEQADLLARFGVDLEKGAGPVKALLSTLAVLAAATLAVSFFVLRNQKPPQDQVTLAWMLFCEKMARIGVHRHAAQGPMDFLQSAVRQRPELEGRLNEIVSRYVRLRYSARAGAEEVAALLAMVKHFHPKQSMPK